MKRFALLISIFTLLASAAYASPFTFNCNHFDYSNDGIGTGYINLAMSDTGTLELHLTNGDNGASVGSVDVDGEVRGHDGTLIAASKYRAHRDIAGRMFGAMAFDYRGHDFHLIRITHDGQPTNAVEAQYLAQLGALGFEVEAEQRLTTTRTYRVNTDEGAIRLRFTREAGDTLVTFTAW